MKLTKLQDFVLALGCLAVIAGYFLFTLGRPLKAPSEEARRARQEALEIAELFPTGGYVRVVQPERPYGGVRIVLEEEHGRATVEILVSEKSFAPEWPGCERGDRISLSVREFPEVRLGDDTSSIDNVEHFLRPYCQSAD